ncbi:chromosome segregation protein SMC [Lentibacillus saliphilus]|uniref:chromosome segregation protein SMC n=1 Tax=Lentibacillus saliphilus TaxID=2737028 RepID=UPI001C2F2732|nr:chromosome segregation protein SMC [Lentibacillus saliphilus]
MYLKRLESAGFKSFAERINVEFVPGVTAVVGPNGSGKSNITDAIRWVLGEQSAKSLRGSKMQDIIFQGSDTRKPLNVADVTLVLDNEDHTLPLDYNEVSITRRVYRSGESEFYINKQSCRLKDIVDLFMDSGLGREAFSIISQGKVEEILSSKAEDRRVIFEEAAGVLKYKQRKRQAEFKLNETQDNLNRVEDIIHEIEQQVDPLQEQAEKAQTFLTYKKDLDEKEISLLITEIDHFHEEWQALLKELEQHKDKEVALSTSIQKREAELEQEQTALKQLDEAIEDMQNQLISVTQSLEQYEGKKQVLQERLKHFSENKTKLEAQKAAALKRISEIKDQLQAANAEIQRLETEKRETNERVKELKALLSSREEQINDEIEDAKAEYIEYLNEQAVIRNEQQSIAEQKEQLLHKKDHNDEKYHDLILKSEELEKQVELAEARHAERENDYNTKNSHLQKLKADVKQYREQFQQAQATLYKGFRTLEKLKSQKEMLESMKEDFQGFFHGVKSVLKARDEHHLSNINGAVIELIDVPEQYVTAIETVLGAQAQHVVVKDDQAARTAINWLKKTNNGRATFLPLSSIQPRYIAENMINDIRSHKGYIGIAAELIQVSPVYQKAVDHLMGHVIIAETLQDANDLARKVMRKYRIVTLDGDVVNPGGSMSGGAKKQSNHSLFTRDKELTTIAKKLEDYEVRAKAFQQTVSQKEANVQQTEAAIRDLEQELSEKQSELLELQSAYRELIMKRDASKQSITHFNQDQKQFGDDINQMDEKAATLSDNLSTIQAKLVNIQEHIDTLNARKNDIEHNRERRQQELHTAQVQLAEQAAHIDNQYDKTDALKSQLRDLEEEYETFSQELDELLSLKDSEVTESDIDSSIASIQNDKQSITENIKQQRDERLRRTQLLQDEERELKEANKAHQSLLHTLQQTEVQVNRHDVELETRLKQLETDHTMTYEKAKQTYPKSANVDEAKKEVQALKQSIDHLGFVNLGAIEEYERVSERYTFLSTQRDDLLEAKGTLYQVIDEMDEEMMRRFDTTFNQIKAQFSIVFTELFGGGHAELKLTTPDDLLDTGVDIIAQPPGKKLQHLGLLSGGERALTAIALLFSILRVRPVPFCVLDEVEAALDEANVVRFARYIKQFSADTQFIVITHRKGTMEEADVLYGVTMQESGVSRLVSVRLEDTAELVTS